MEHVRGKTAFITGGARGIGLGIARAFAGAGLNLGLADIDEHSLALAKRELSSLTLVETFLLDVRDRTAYSRVADEMESRLGLISILCNNAGVGGEPHVSRLTFADWDWIMGVNLNGVMNGIQTFLPRMLERGEEAHIVNTGSGAGLAATPSGLSYTTSKFAVIGLSEFLRPVLEPSRIGVSVLCPGPVSTNLILNSRASQPSQSWTPEETMTWETIAALQAAGMNPDVVGEMVLAAIKTNQLYIHTDRIMAEMIAARTKALLDAMPQE
jgi:NAD(P)-dependent dehydrogenase (short-subunit alcohol dehydrogenase family)